MFFVIRNTKLFEITCVIHGQLLNIFIVHFTSQHHKIKFIHVHKDNLNTYSLFLETLNINETVRNTMIAS